MSESVPGTLSVGWHVDCSHHVMAEPSYRVLVVEDVELLRRLMIAALRQRGHRVEVVGDGDEALPLLEERTFDLLVTDYHMPRMNGLALIRAVQARPKPIPVVLMSSNSPEELALTAKDLQGVEFLRKPFGLTDLYAAMRRAMDPSKDNQ